MSDNNTQVNTTPGSAESTPPTTPRDEASQLNAVPMLEPPPLVRNRRRRIPPPPPEDEEGNPSVRRRLTYQILVRLMDDFEDPQCSICHENVVAGHGDGALPCRHAFHQHCIREWVHIRDRLTCPMCVRTYNMFVMVQVNR